MPFCPTSLPKFKPMRPTALFGVYQMSELRYGKYLVKETKAPTGFVLDEDVYAVSIEENGKTYTVENKAGVGFINAAQKGSLKIVKTSSAARLATATGRIRTAAGTAAGALPWRRTYPRRRLSDHTIPYRRLSTGKIFYASPA